MKKAIPILMIVFLLLVSGCRSGDLVLKGTVETNLYAHYVEINGKIIDSPIQLGQVVQAGDLLAVIDSSTERNYLQQLKATLAKKQAFLAELVKGADSAEIKQGQNMVSLAEQTIVTAQLDMEQVLKNYNEIYTLYENAAISANVLDDAEYKKKLAEEACVAAQTQLDNSRQNLALILKGAGREKIAQAQADVELTAIQIQQTEDNLGKYTVRALETGTVVSKNYILGDMVAPGYNLADIAGNLDKYLLAYIPEDYLHTIDFGQELVIQKAGQTYPGRLIYIDVKAQYTPKDMQTTANKNKESFKIKIALPADTPLKPGETAEIIIPAP